MTWHHSPHHKLKAEGVFIITAATLHKEHLFKKAEDLDQLQNTLFVLVKKYHLGLRAWALFPNHYHLIILTYPSTNLPLFIRHFHSLSARNLNITYGAPGRKIWFQCWDTQLTHQSSYFARLHYVMQNPVRHRIVSDAKDYRWCSAKWFADNADSAHQRTIYSHQTDCVNVMDDF